MPSVSPHSVSLTWDLLIATKDRLEELQLCIELACEQSRPPSRIVVVDASEGWRDHAARIGTILMRWPAIRLDYQPARKPSLTVQRNQALDAAESDIVFMIDDDSFMYPGCAEEILGIYEADPDRALAGVQASLASRMPRETDMVAAETGSAAGAAVEAGRFRWILSNVFLMGAEKIFIPYDGGYPEHVLPPHLRDLDVIPMRLFHGARMTFRREAIQKVRFDPILQYYSPFEDLDASYRVSREGALVTAKHGHLYHYTTSTNRMKRFEVTWLSMLSQAVLVRRHAKDGTWGKRAYHLLMMRRLLAEFLKDTLSRRARFPQIRGALRALADSRRAFSLSDADLEAWYPEWQTRIVKGR